MEVILSIVFVVAGVSLYDYYTARRWQQVTSVVRSSIVFENRNQEYGAYALRRDYDKRMVLIMLGFVLSIGLVFGIHAIIKNLPEETVELPVVESGPFDVPAPPVEETPPPPEETPPPPLEEAMAFLPPVVVDIPVNDDIPPQNAMDDIKADNKTVVTDVVNWDPIVDDDSKKIVVVDIKEDPIIDFVDEEAQYIGGHTALLAFMGSKVVYPQVPQELGITGRCYIAFTVNTDGSIQNVRVERGIPDCSECDKEAVRVVKLMPNWKPGKLNGKVVRSVCRMPVDFVLE